MAFSSELEWILFKSHLKHYLQIHFDLTSVIIKITIITYISNSKKGGLSKIGFSMESLGRPRLNLNIFELIGHQSMYRNELLFRSQAKFLRNKKIINVPHEVKVVHIVNYNRTAFLN